MPEPDGAAKDTEPRQVSSRPLTAWRPVLLCAAGLAGGVVVGTLVGFVGLLVGLAVFSNWHDSAKARQTMSVCSILGAVLGTPLGTATGLRVAGTRLGIGGRFWPAVAGSFAGLLASYFLLQFFSSRTLVPDANPAVSRSLLNLVYYSVPTIFTLVGGLVGYQLSRRRDSGKASPDP